MDKRLVFALVAAIQVFAALHALDVRWDEAVYIMNSRYFSGQKTYIELIRPPVLALLLIPLNWSMILMRLAYALMGLVLCWLCYLIMAEFGKEKEGKIVALLVSTNSLFFYWSHWIYSEIPATMFALASVLFYLRFRKEDSTRLILLSFFAASMAFLTKYTFGILLPVMLLLLAIDKKIDPRALTGIAVFFIPLLPWLLYNWLLAGNALYTFEWGIFWPASHESDFWLYFTRFPEIFTSQLLIIPLAFMKKKRAHAPLFVFPIILFLFHQFFSYRETRYLLPIVPFVLLLAGLEIKKEWLKFLVPIMAAGLVIGYNQVIPSLACGRDAFSKIGPLEGRVLSVAWPLSAYYSGVEVKAFPEDPLQFRDFVAGHNITYIVSSDAYGWPGYARDQGFFEGYEVYKQASDSCKSVWVYSVQKT